MAVISGLSGGQPALVLVSASTRAALEEMRNALVEAGAAATALR